MDYLNGAKNFIFNVFRVMAKVLEIWKIDRFNLDYNEDIGFDKDGQKGTIRDAVDTIINEIFGS
jgi:hypothetical protein